MDGCLAGVVHAGVCLAGRRAPGGRGSAAVLPALAAEALQAAGLGAAALGGVAVTVGPGSFTGVRAGLALAHGIALAADVPLLGVSTGDAIRAAPTLAAAGRPVWVALDSKRGRVFLDTGDAIAAVGLDALPMPDGPVAVAGDAAAAVVQALSARGIDAVLLPLSACCSRGIVAGARAAGRAPLPLYVDPVAARPNAARPAPA